MLHSPRGPVPTKQTGSSWPGLAYARLARRPVAPIVLKYRPGV
jgi:hypothetical protein